MTKKREKNAKVRKKERKKCCESDPCPMLDGDGVKAMPGSIPAPIPGSFSIRKERKYR